jgi:glycosyltransferase involved in cell wall biosynthesis
MIAWLSRPRAILWLLACAAAVRLGAYAAFAPLFDFAATGIIHGSTAYDTYARNLLATSTYGLQPGTPDAVLPPLYSASLAAVYALAGRGALPVVILNVGLDLVALVAIRRLGTRMFPAGAAVGALAAACTAFYPYLVFQSLTVVDTSLFIALLYLFLAMMVDLRSAGDVRTIWRQGALGGVVLGLATLTRPVTPPLVALVAVWLWVTLGARGMLTRMVPVAIGATLVVAPWCVRNTGVFGALVPVTTNGGSNFWQGNNADTVRYLRAGYDAQWVPAPHVNAADRLGPEADAEMFQLALGFLGANPGEIPALVWTKLRVQWSLDVSPRLNPSSEGPAARPGSVIADAGRDGGLRLAGVPDSEPVVIYRRPLFDTIGRLVHRLYWGSLFVLGIAGSLASRRRWRDVSLVWAPAIALTLVYVVTHPSTRYRVPGDPGWFLFSAVALVSLPRVGRRAGASPERAAERGDSRAGICWIGSARYQRPLDPTSARKWHALASVGRPMHVVAFSSDLLPRRFVEHASFFLLPNAPFAPVRAAMMVLAAPLIVLWLAGARGARILIAQSPVEGALAAAAKILLALVGRPVALVIESHGDFEASLPLYRRLLLPRLSRSFRNRLVGFALAHADVGRAVSASTRLQLRRRVPNLPVETVPTWLDAEAFSRIVRACPPGASRDVLFVGTLVPIKGVHHLIDAFARVAPRIDASRLLVAGPAPSRGYSAELRSRIASLGLTGQVDLLGELSTAEVAALMARARVLVVPSLSEGLPRVALEAMLVGTPVIATRVGGLPEIVRDGETGWLVPAGSVDALAEALIRAHGDAEVDALGARARDFARRTVSADAYVAAHRRLVAAAAARLQQP